MSQLNLLHFPCPSFLHFYRKWPVSFLFKPKQRILARCNQMFLSGHLWDCECSLRCLVLFLVQVPNIASLPTFCDSDPYVPTFYSYSVMNQAAQTALQLSLLQLLIINLLLQTVNLLLHCWDSESSYDSRPILPLLGSVSLQAFLFGDYPTWPVLYATYQCIISWFQVDTVYSQFISEQLLQ